jgi:hypothetical protein
MFGRSRQTISPNVHQETLTLLRDPACHILDDVDKVHINEDTFNQQIPEYRGGKLTVFFFTIPENPDDFLEMVKSLFWIASLSDINLEPIESLTIYINIIRSLMNKTDAKLRKALTDSAMLVESLSADETDIWIDAASGNTLASEAYNEIQMSTSVGKALSGIFLNFITKRLTSSNLENWYKSRVAAYAKICSIREDHSVMMELRPSFNFTENINSIISSCFPVKTMIFRIVQSLSSLPTHSLGGLCQVTMVYFHMAELTGFGMVHSEILMKNPILLAWNGLAKHTPKLYAALTLFRRLGDDAPYCKFIYKPHELKVFQFSNIGIFVTIAHEILVMEGHQIFSNYKGIQSSNASQALIGKVREIINMFGGAKTKQSDTTRREVLVNPDEMNELMKVLNSGLHILDSIEEQGTSSPN